MPTSPPPPPVIGIALWLVIVILIVAGAIGGLVNAYFASEGFTLSRFDTLADGVRIWRPGFLGNVFVGSVAAFVLGGLYGPLAQIIIGTHTLIPLSIGVVAGAVISGVGGARILTQEVDKRIADATNKQISQTLNNLVAVSQPKKQPE